MRLIGSLNDERQGIIFSTFLKQKGIPHQLELYRNTDWGSDEYGITKCSIWVQDEDQVPEALKWYHFYLENPNDPIFQRLHDQLPFSTVTEIGTSTMPPPPPPQEEAIETPSELTTWERQAMGPVTRLILMGCCLLFFIGQLMTPVTEVPANLSAFSLFSSPIAKTILYDYPHTYQLIDKFIQTYGYEGLQDPSGLPPGGRDLLKQINATPYWQGIYPLIQKEGFARAVKELPSNDIPMFEKIRQGEIWRLFTPCVYHADLFHLFFNMLWLIVLGKQIEQRTGPWRYLIFILFVGIISNTAQYLMSGPNFVGFSGILTAMLTFIWMRQRDAPWEGYQLDKATIIFMLIFILSMAALQFISFFLEKTMDLSISPGIANVAHLSGVLLGLLLARLNFFSWRHA